MLPTTIKFTKQNKKSRWNVLFYVKTNKSYSVVNTVDFSYNALSKKANSVIELILKLSH